MEITVTIPQAAIEALKDEIECDLIERLSGGRAVGDEVLNVAEAAKLMKVSQSSVYRIAENYPDFPVKRFGRRTRILKNELLDWLGERDFVLIRDPKKG